jgi:hypothetical protein
MAIEMGQAGQSLTCHCGAILNVPTMREIARLPPVKESLREDAVPRWSTLQSAVFTSGVLLTAGALLSATFFGVAWSRLEILAPPLEDDAEWVRFMNKATPEELLDLWSQIESQGLGPWLPPKHLIARNNADELLRRVKIMLAVAACGACLAGSSFLLGSSRRGRRK